MVTLKFEMATYFINRSSSILSLLGSTTKIIPNVLISTVFKRSITSLVNKPLVTPGTHSCLCMSLIHKRTKTKKAKNKKKNLSVKIDTSISDGVVDLSKVKREMVSSVERMKDDFKLKYAPKLTPGTLDKLAMQIDGENSLLYEVAQVSSNGKEFTITPMVEGANIQKQLIHSIQSTGLNLNPRADGSVIKIPISIASSDYKANLVKLAKSSAEKSKVLIRKIRQQGLVELRKEKDNVSQDISRLIEKQIQQLTDVHVEEIDRLLAQKEGELKS